MAGMSERLAKLEGQAIPPLPRPSAVDHTRRDDPFCLKLAAAGAVYWDTDHAAWLGVDDQNLKRRVWDELAARLGRPSASIRRPVERSTR